MARKRGAINIWREMKPASLRRFALAAFLLFSVLGLLSILTESKLRPHPWVFVIVQTGAYGGLAASLILSPVKRWWAAVLIIAVWGAVLVMNSGGLSFVFNQEGFRVHLGKAVGSTDEGVEARRPAEPLVLSAGELDAIYTQRAIAGTAAIVLLIFSYVSFMRGVRLEVRERARLETEVTIAKEIQQSLLPQSPVKTAWCGIAGLTVPMTEVGGDYFDCVELEGEVIAVAIADVTGHGVGAGILSAMTKSVFHSELEHDSSPEVVLRNVNRTVHRMSDGKTFVTFAYARLDRKARTVAIATAGHPPVFHRDGRTGAITRLRTAALGLGMREDTLFSSIEVPWLPGDRLLLYTDGALELTNRKEEQFGMDRLAACFQANGGEPGDICAGIISELRSFSSEEEFRDDVTLVCIAFSAA
jgi:serine phosphatase RsbU (regulator of sigma subunit)